MRKLIPVAAVAVWLAACAGVYDISAMSGGDHREQAKAAAGETQEQATLTPACTRYAENLAEAALRARATARRPTARLMKEREREAERAYIDGRCPVRALPVLYFLVADATAKL